MRRSLAAALCLVAALTACSRSTGAHAPTISPSTRAAAPAPSPSSLPAPSPSPSPVAQGSVFVIVMENRSYDQAISGGFTAQLAAQYAVATDYHGVSHPSLPNYLAMTSGSTWGIADDGYHPLPQGGLGEQLSAAGISWRAYMEGMNGTCLSSSYPYALKHDPFGYYGGGCPPQVVPFTAFGADLAGGSLPRFAWITPGLCNDGHDCSTAVADGWLSRIIPAIQATPEWQNNGLIIVTWDEGEDAANHVLTLLIAPNSGHLESSRFYNHYSLLATLEDRFGVARMGEAGAATPMTDLLVSGG